MLTKLIELNKLIIEIASINKWINISILFLIFLITKNYVVRIYVELVVLKTVHMIANKLTKTDYKTTSLINEKIILFLQ